METKNGQKAVSTLGVHILSIGGVRQQPKLKAKNNSFKGLIPSTAGWLHMHTAYWLNLPICSYVWHTEIYNMIANMSIEIATYT